MEGQKNIGCTIQEEFQIKEQEYYFFFKILYAFIILLCLFSQIIQILRIQQPKSTARHAG